MKIGVLTALCCTMVGVDPAQAQRLLEEWRVRPTAGAEALVTGAAAVFWNPAQVTLAGGRIEAVLLDLRAPGITGVSGVGLAAALQLDERTVLGVGYEHIGVDGIEQTTTSPEGEGALDVGENRFAAAASHVLGPRLRVGALVQYTRLPQFSSQRSVLALGAGANYRPSTTLPLQIAAMAATEGEETYWFAGVEFASGARWPDLVARGEYGLAGGTLAPGVMHRVAITAQWRQLAEATVGLLSEPDGDARAIQPVLGGAVRVSRYRLGAVRERLANDFGAAYSFRFSVGF